MNLMSDERVIPSLFKHWLTDWLMETFPQQAINQIICHIINANAMGDPQNTVLILRGVEKWSGDDGDVGNVGLVCLRSRLKETNVPGLSVKGRTDVCELMNEWLGCGRCGLVLNVSMDYSYVTKSPSCPQALVHLTGFNVWSVFPVTLYTRTLHVNAHMAIRTLKGKRIHTLLSCAKATLTSWPLLP